MNQPSAGRGSGGQSAAGQDSGGQGAGKEPRRSGYGSAYQGAFEAGLAVVVGVAAGAYADSKFDTSPIFLFTGVILGFGTFVLRLVRLLRALQPPADSGEKPRETEER